MRHSIAVLLTLLSALVAAVPGRRQWGTTGNHGYSNRIFNSLIDSMRQFNAALHHNGMTFYLAHVPEKTEFYHGTTTPYRINGTEWLAFEPEHALFFARVVVGKFESLANNDKDSSDKSITDTPPRRQHASSEQSQQAQQPLGLPQEIIANEEHRHGYLHTYRTKRALRLIYIDGQGAAKCEKGTLDSQDIVIRNLRRGSGETLGVYEDRQRAAEMCAIAAKAWHGEIDGFIRMEGGFELILCDFAKHLDVISIQTASFAGISRDFETMGYLSAIAARYDDIGDNRVTIDFENMVSMYPYDGLVYIDDDNLPHVDNTSSQLAAAQAQLKRVASGKFTKHGHNWQATADMVVARYSEKIEYLGSSAMTSLSDMQTYLDYVLRAHTDYANRDPDAEILKCAAQFWPSSQPPITSNAHLGTAAAAVRSVALEICAALSDMRDKAATFDEARSRLRDLKQWLGWAIFKRCRGCMLGEYCFVPVWPWGAKEDYDNPRCRTKIHGGGPGDNETYWGPVLINVTESLGQRWLAFE